MYGLGPQKFLRQAVNQKPGDSSFIQNEETPGPANHPNQESDTAEMNAAQSEDMENNDQMNIDKAKVNDNELKASTKPVDSGDQKDGFFAELKKKAKDYLMKKGTEKMSAMMNPDGDNKSEGSKEETLANENPPAENRPVVDKPYRPQRNDPKGHIPKTPKGPVNNTPTPKMPKVAMIPKPRIPRMR